MRGINDKDIIKFVGYIIRIILLLGIIFQVILTVLQIVSDVIKLNILDLVNSTIIGSLLILVFLELYIAVNNYLSGKERSIANVIDAGISFVVREIILELFSANTSITNLLILAGIVGILTLSRFLASK
ncbi:hypothetical protein BFU36_06080 [Sulfolobus sp. A20]|uniref:phosphate-starvation-inducible PsiE family protein n=1 Tax=Sulfolobaceae TaxID=118883 RepID=UPI000845D597|nr:MULTISPECIES: phosphate-starvation-inducible PsiE family protein [unclassified Sulfolobus]TRM75742.1 hypothetical protein DJ523_02395 [Sulfolobus sp. E5]TRM75902.1 hypothetical protein DJ532_08950 [Sulfolobus sp. A20-N-F8]TRM77463.1 hypothetical protein DJ528_06650 [Sulfolobus sp. B5]TRM79807.1 hypothetical protein DJ524_09465 [Sulfolobus sp. D5]TRM80908.1 hypothetical protein DJ531_11665 [Sulfolobus sp. A20-N-F6]TRM84963.1 hypothetical protein DJ522_02650 [Sulfolobus sp. F3]TRM85874.1 hy